MLCSFSKLNYRTTLPCAYVDVGFLYKDGATRTHDIVWLVEEDGEILLSVCSQETEVGVIYSKLYPVSLHWLQVLQSGRGDNLEIVLDSSKEIG